MQENVTKVLQGSVRVCTRSSVMQLVPGATKMEVRTPALHHLCDALDGLSQASRLTTDGMHCCTRLG